MPALKIVGSSGQIAFGKQYAGRHVMVDQVEPGVWVVKLGEFIPDNERWLHTEEARDALDEAVRWAEDHPPEATDLDDLEAAVES